MERFDVLVLGGGPAGCVLAARLSENGDRSVCLVEAGPDYGSYAAANWPADILDGRRLALDSHCWERDAEDRSQLRARILGGCSAHNACVLLRGAPADYDEWGPGWSHEELAPYLDRGERELRTRVFEEAELSPWHRAFLDAARESAIVHPVNAVAVPGAWLREPPRRRRLGDADDPARQHASLDRRDRGTRSRVGLRSTLKSWRQRRNRTGSTTPETTKPMR